MFKQKPSRAQSAPRGARKGCLLPQKIPIKQREALEQTSYLLEEEEEPLRIPLAFPEDMPEEIEDDYGDEEFEKDEDKQREGRLELVMAELEECRAELEGARDETNRVHAQKAELKSRLTEMSRKQRKEPDKLGLSLEKARERGAECMMRLRDRNDKLSAELESTTLELAAARKEAIEEKEFKEVAVSSKEISESILDLKKHKLSRMQQQADSDAKALQDASVLAEQHGRAMHCMAAEAEEARALLGESKQQVQQLKSELRETKTSAALLQTDLNKATRATQLKATQLAASERQGLLQQQQHHAELVQQAQREHSKHCLELNQLRAIHEQAAGHAAERLKLVLKEHEAELEQASAKLESEREAHGATRAECSQHQIRTRALQEQIEALNAEVTALRNELSALKELVGSTSADPSL